jgi:hypothetical protein
MIRGRVLFGYMLMAWVITMLVKACLAIWFVAHIPGAVGRPRWA